MKKGISILLLSFIFILLLSFMLGLGGCRQSEGNKAEDLLIEFYTVNDTEKLESLTASLEEASLSDLNEQAEKVKKATIEYHEAFQSFFTEDGFSLFINGRHLYNLHSLAKSENYQLEPRDIELVSENDPNHLSFKLMVMVKEQNSNNPLSVTQSGQIVLSEEQLVESVWFDNLNDIYDLGK